MLAITTAANNYIFLVSRELHARGLTMVFFCCIEFT
jgi:hypothetical protein